MALTPKQEDAIKVITDLVVANCEAIRTGTTAGGVTNCVTLSSKVRALVNEPSATLHKQFFDRICALVTDYMAQHFGSQLLQGPYDPRRLFQGASAFAPIVKSIESAIRFTFLSLDNALRNTSILLIKDMPFEALSHTLSSTREVATEGRETLTVREEIYECIKTHLNEVRDSEQKIGASGGSTTLGSSVDSVRQVIEFIQKINSKEDRKRNEAVLENNFVAYYCASVKQYFKTVASINLQAYSDAPVVYANWAGRRINQEREWLGVFGMGNNWDNLKKPLTETLVDDKFMSVVHDPNGGLARELDVGNDVSDLFALLELVVTPTDQYKGVHEVCKTYHKFLVSRILGFLDAPAPPVDPNYKGPALPPHQYGCYKKFFEFAKHQVHSVWPKQFKKNNIVINTIREAIEEAFKSSSMKVLIPQFHASVCNEFFRGVNDTDLTEEIINGIFLITHVFTALSQKDEFFEHHKKFLAKRILKSNARLVAEKAFLRELKTLIGNSETHLLFFMISDVENSTKLSKDFSDTTFATHLEMEKERFRGLSKANFTIISRSYWPSLELKTEENMKHIPIITSVTDLFKRFYINKYPTRLLNWIPNLCTATVTVAFPSGAKDLNGTLTQASLLMLMDGKKGITASALADALGLPIKGVCDAIAALVLGRSPRDQAPLNVARMLDPSTMEPVAARPVFKAEGVYGLNTAFKAQVRKIDLPPPMVSKDNSAAKATVEDAIEAFRNLRAQTHIVRFMKSRGTAPYQELLDAVLKEMNRMCEASVPRVKQQIDELIDKQYIKRAESDRKIIEYIA